MAGTQYQVRSFGDLIVSRKLTKLADRAADMRPAWPSVMPVIARGYENAYKKEGPQWRPLQPSTERRRIAEGYPPGPIRTRKGDDRELMTDPDFLEAHSFFDRDELSVQGTDVSELHQFGFRVGKRGYAPARPLRLTRYYHDQIARAIERALLEAYHDG